VATDGIYAKLDRADEHVKALHTKTSAALESADNGVRIDPNPQPGEVSLLARVNLVPDIRWSVIIGECVYQLRSALDHLAHQLSARNGPVPEGCEFPISAMLPSFPPPKVMGSRKGRAASTRCAGSTLLSRPT